MVRDGDGVGQESGLGWGAGIFCAGTDRLDGGGFEGCGGSLGQGYGQGIGHGHGRSEGSGFGGDYATQGLDWEI